MASPTSPSLSTSRGVTYFPAIDTPSLVASVSSSSASLSTPRGMSTPPATQTMKRHTATLTHSMTCTDISMAHSTPPRATLKRHRSTVGVSSSSECRSTSSATRTRSTHAESTRSGMRSRLRRTSTLASVSGSRLSASSATMMDLGVLEDESVSGSVIVSELQDKLKKSEGKVRKLEGKLKELNKLSSDLLTQYDELVKSKADLQVKYDKLHESFIETSKHLQSSVSSMTKNLADSEAEKSRLRLEIEELHTKFNEIDRVNVKLQMELEKLEDQGGTSSMLPILAESKSADIEDSKEIEIETETDSGVRSRSDSQLSMFSLSAVFDITSDSMSVTNWFLTSKILVDKLGPKMNDLLFHNLCSFERVELLYRGSRDGFGSESFHEHCDERGFTLVIMRSKCGQFVSGGFTRQPWNTSTVGEYRTDKQAWLFVLRSSEDLMKDMPLLFQVRSERAYSAVFHKSDTGPAFGHDLVVCSNAHLNPDCYSLLGSSYQMDHSFHSSKPIHLFPPLSNSLLMGSEDFSLSEIEVFRVYT